MENQKRTTPEEWVRSIPSGVMYIQFCKSLGKPVASSIYDKVLKEYPEYFPEEAERIRRWENVPKDVHEAYQNEMGIFLENLWKGQPSPPGIRGAAYNTEEFQKWKIAYYRLAPIEEQKDKELHEKYYGPYGL